MFILLHKHNSSKNSSLVCGWKAMVFSNFSGVSSPEAFSFCLCPITVMRHPWLRFLCGIWWSSMKSKIIFLMDCHRDSVLLEFEAEVFRSSDIHLLSNCISLSALYESEMLFGQFRHWNHYITELTLYNVDIMKGIL